MRRVYTIEAAITILLVVAFYHPLLRFGSMQSGGDAANLFWPMRIVVAESLWRSGIVPLWNPWSFMGTPLAATMQHAVFYPIDWVIYGIFPAHIGMNLGNLLHLSLAALGVHAWLRLGLNLSSIPAVCLGAAFPCTAWFWGHQEHINQLAATAWFPWQVFVLWQFLRSRIEPLPFLLIFTGLSAFQFLAGHPQEAFYAHNFCLLLAIGYVIIRRPVVPHLKRILPVYVCSGVLTLLIVGVQLLPTMELSRYSLRQFPDPAYPVSVSMPPDLLITYIIPHYYGSYTEGYFLKGPDGELLFDENANPITDLRSHSEYGLYVGIVTLLLAVWALIGKNRRKLHFFLLIMAAMGLLLALGGNTDPRRVSALDFTEMPGPGFSLYEIYTYIFFPARGFRVPPRILIWVSFSMISLSAIGFEKLLPFLKSTSIALPVQLAIATAILLSLYLPSRKEKFHYPAEMGRLLAAKAYGAWIDSTSPHRRHFFGARIFRLTISDESTLLAERQRATQPENNLFHRFNHLQPHLNAVGSNAVIEGYEEGLSPTARYRDFLNTYNRNLRQFSPDRQLLALMGVRSIVTDLPIDTTSLILVGEPDIAGWKFLNNPLWRGTAFPLSDTEGFDISRLDGPMMSTGEPLGGRNTEPIPMADLNLSPVEEPGAEVRLRNLNQLYILDVGRPDSSAAEDYLLAMGWYPGWVFTGEDGLDHGAVEWQSAVHALLPADQARLIPVNGKEMRGWHVAYRPFAYRAGLFLTAIGIALWVCLGAMFMRWRS